MRASFRRFLTSRHPARWQSGLRGACLGAVGIASLLVGGCGSMPRANALVPTAQPAHGAPNTCAGMRQFLASHAMAVSTPTLGPGEHRTYQLDVLGPVLPQIAWQPGATMRFFWCANYGQPTTDAHAQPERLTAQLIGPFDSLEAASQAMQKLSPTAAPGGPSFPNVATLGPIAASAPPLTTTTWSTADIPMALRLPSTLKPGSYIFVSQVEMPSATGGVTIRPESDAIYQVSAS